MGEEEEGGGGGRGSGLHLPIPCIKLNADPKNITETTIDRNFLSVVTRMVVTADVSACRRYTPNMQTTYAQSAMRTRGDDA